MKKEKWWDVLKSTKPKRKPGEFNSRDELLREHQGPPQGKGGYNNSRLRTFGGKFGKANKGESLTAAQIAAWKKENGFA